MEIKVSKTLFSSLTLVEKFIYTKNLITLLNVYIKVIRLEGKKVVIMV